MVEYVTENGPFGKYGNYENHCRANDFSSLTTWTPAERLNSIAETMIFAELTGINLGSQYLKDSHIAAMVGWMAGSGFYSNVSDNIHICNPGILIPTDGKRSEQQPYVDLTVYDSVFSCRINDAGKMLSRHENLRQDLANYLRSDEGQALLNELKKAGYKDVSLEALAVGFIPKHALMMVAQDENGSVLYRNPEFHKYLESRLEENAVFAEEITHAARRTNIATIIDLILEEKATKEFVKKFYQGKAEGAGKDQEKAKKYRYLEELMEEDLATLGRYWRAYLEIGENAEKAGCSRSHVKALVAKYLEEGRDIYETEEEALEYALEKAEEEVEDSKKKAAKEKSKDKEESGEEADNEEESAEEAEAEEASE